ncbi:YgjV family protein [Uliginosibacterium sp. sgz301328]|uniref:YgjV family protein n=1 Tax=Uliginosibacterium sp. sgz301328 TaxID=3243764 RepID=UPI00359DA6AF
MQLDQALSVTQIFGYLAFAMGVSSFLQKSDQRFKIFMAAECVSYVIHFWLLGNYTAVASSAVSVGRSVAAIRTRSIWVALFFVALSLGFGIWLATSWLSFLPIIASCVGTLSLFLLHGVRMRCFMLIGTCLWLLNNILSGSIGGTMLEATVLATNLLTIRRLQLEQIRKAADLR